MGWEADIPPETEPVQPEHPGLLRRMGQAVVNTAEAAGKGLYHGMMGDDRTQYPERQEFMPAFVRDVGNLDQAQAINRSGVTPDPEAQYDILAKSIPGLQRDTDKFGNLMLKAPGMKDWAYLNKPGLSGRDAEEFLTQTLATAPLLGWAGRAKTALGTVGRGVAGMGAASVAQDAAAIAQGSEQGVDTGRAAVSAGLGGAIPAAAPLVRAGLRTGVEKINDAQNAWLKRTNPKEFAKRQVEGAFQEDLAAAAKAGPNAPGYGASVPTAADVAEARARGQDVRLMDYGGGTVQDLARKQANVSGAARDTIMRVVGPRYEGQTARTRNLFEHELGFDRSVKEVGEDLVTKSRQARSQAYEQAYRAGADGINSAGLQQLSQSPLFARAMQRAQVTMQDRAAVPGLFTTGLRGKNGYTLEYWDQVKQRLDDMHSAARRTGANAKALDIDRLRRSLRGELDTAVPRYAHARSAAETVFDASDALEAGVKFAREKFDLRDAAKAINALNPAERKLFSEGFARQMTKEVRGYPDRTNILNKLNASEMDRERMKLGLGGDAPRLEAFLRVEGMMDRMREAMGNSTTARQLTQFFRDYGLTGAIEAGSAFLHSPHGMLSGLLTGGFKMWGQLLDPRIADHVADLLVSKDPDVFLQGLKQISKPEWIESLRVIDNALSKAGIYRPIAQQQGVNQSMAGDTEQQSERDRAAFAKAREAIANGAEPNQVKQRLLEVGINPKGL